MPIPDYEIEHRIHLTALGITAGLLVANKTIDVNDTIDVIRCNLRGMISELGIEVEKTGIIIPK